MNKKNKFKIQGIVSSTRDGHGVANLKVEAWDKDLVIDDFLGSARTKENGSFTIEFKQSFYQEICFDRKPDVYFKVFRGDELIYSTKDSVLWNMSAPETKVTISIDLSSDDSSLAKDFRRAKSLEFAKLIKLKNHLAAKFAEKDINLEDANEATLNELVEEKILNEKQKKDLLLTIDLGRLSGGNIELMKVLKNDQLKSMVDFIDWEKSNWVKVIKDNKIPLPEGEESVESYAENLRDNIEKTFASPYFLKRVIKNEYKNELKILNSVESLIEQSSPIIKGTKINSETLDWRGIRASDKQRMEKDLDQLLAFTNTYRYLGIAEIVNDKKLNTNKKKTAITQRLSKLDHFYENNPNLDLSLVNLANKDTKLNWSGIEKNERAMVKKQVMAYQRVLTMTEDYKESRILLSKGYDSNLVIANKTEREFLKTSGLELKRGRKVYRSAQDKTVATSNFFEAIRDAQHGLFREIALSNQGSLVNDLHQIDGFEELFGSQDFCDCRECRSIFSPAAYFTDLMYFTEEHVSKNVFEPSLTDHPLYLKNRRPDLWKLKLTCQNTNTLIPYLEVVNDVLEQYTQNDLSVADIYEMLQQSNLSCTLPFNLPLQELRLYMSHFDLSLHDIYKILEESPKTQQREKLNISKKELEIITTPDTAGACTRFGNIALANFDVQDFIRLAGISRKDLGYLLSIKFLPEIAKVKVKTIESPIDIQRYDEVLISLTDIRLDLIHRFLRFWKKTPWTIREFDLVLNALKTAGLLNNLEENDMSGRPKVLNVAELIIIQEALNLSVEEICVMIDDIPQLSIEDNQKGLYERIFDLEKIFGVASTAADGTVTYNTAATLLADKTQDKITPLLLAGLGINETELEDLFELIQADTTIDLPVNRALISKLFRHACIAKGLKLSIEDFIIAIKLRLGGSEISQLDQIHDLIKFTSWVKSSPFKLSELIMILQGEESSMIKFQNDIDSVVAAMVEIKNTDGYSDNTLDKKRDLLKAYLQRDFNLTAEQLMEEFLPELVTVDIEGPGIQSALEAGFTDDVPNNPSDFDELVKLVRELERYNLFFGNLQFEADSITFFIGNKDVFGVADLKNITLDNIRNASFYKSLIETNSEMQTKIEDMLKSYQTSSNFSSQDIKVLSDLWKRPQGQIKSITESSVFPATALEAVKKVWKIQNICGKLGIEAHSLIKLKANDYSGLNAARDILIGAFASKYADEETRKEKLESYIDKINTLKRDALCDYIIARRDTFKFKDRGDLYNFFLLDVEMGGCFRTSKVVAAVSSVQLYIHRCLINLEQSDKDLNPAIININVNPTWIPADEWEWRKNYRVWEANRKVFMYPENYIVPTLRDNKTHIFKELEEELLQEKITQESAETAYKKYMSQFAELTRLCFAGAYHHSIPGDCELIYIELSADMKKYKKKENAFHYVAGASLSDESEESLYYLFARTNVDPYQYYYRTYNHYKEVWGNWKKIELAIEAKEISVLVHMGKLYIYWTEVKCKEINNVEGGSSKPGGAVFKVFVKYSFLNENGKWSAPQRLYTGYSHFEEQKIYERVQSTYPINEKERDRKHDYVFEQFEQKVFRKPYARIHDDTKTPIKLAYIWSHEKEIQQVRYTTNNFSKVYNLYYSLYHFLFSINIPSKKFLIDNNQFDVSKTVTCSMRLLAYLYNGMRIFDQTFSIDGTLTLSNASTCTFYTKLDFLSFVGDVYIYEAIPVSVQTLPINIKASTYSSSLSKNEITDTSVADIKEHSSYKNITDTSVSFLKKEYDVAYRENSNFFQYVEDGTKYFTDSYRVLAQFRWGGGYLKIANNDGTYDFVMLTTILTDELSDILYAKGLEQFLSLQTQQMTDSCCGLQFDFKGAYGEYYWEMFFHVPFLIANHLNANQKFKEAKWWYERIFNPTAEEEPSSTKPSDHNWQFRMFRNLDIEKLRDILTDEKTIEAYKNDPFNPHAIARLRLSAYQKAIVMKYIDNLIDWGDHLFAQDTRESINEANMLYQLAADILGKRPVKMGECKTVPQNRLTYEKIGPEIDKGSEFLIMLEHVYMEVRNQYKYDVKPVETYKNLRSILVNAGLTKKPNSLSEIEEATNLTRLSDMFSGLVEGFRLAEGGIVTRDTVAGAAVAYDTRMNYRIGNYADKVKSKKQAKNKKDVLAEAKGKYKDKIKEKRLKRFPGIRLIKQSTMAFCVPHNADLLKYWDRVEDRLYKIRNCMNISGVRRSLALFQPPIDPMMLVRARAAGLSLEDISALVAGLTKIPNYRFSYLIEKTKQFTQTVQGFGTSLLSALEKKDVEELTLLRSLHERNILKMSKDIKKKQLQEAQYQYKAMEEALTNIQNRIDYYQGLIDDGLTGWEVTQQVSKHIASGLKIAESVVHLMAGITFLIPQIGSPFAMKYGGQELGNSGVEFAQWTSSMASIANEIASSAGLEATFQRREQDWKQQLKLAKQEYKQVNNQALAAEIRSLIAEKDLLVHEKNMEQAEELNDFYKNKFSNLGLYNYMASTLNRLYRQAYNLVYDMAKKAERAYQFELDESSIFIANDNWQFDRAGLLAGEKLQLQLLEMEQAYLEKNIRIPEITQSFSLALLDAAELINLRQTGTCTIKIPEIAFEVLYPGQYKRLIKSVRLTIPCVVGPYTNVSAKLTLLKGIIEKEDKAALTELPVNKNTSICTSSANSDAGVFEFNFRDERYLPFEGSGAISEWRLELPSTIRSFNYDTISDVIMHISYTAKDGDRVNAENELVTAISDYATTNGLFRLFSLRHEFPDAYHQLMNPVTGEDQKTEFAVEKNHFPYLLINHDLNMVQTKLYLKPKKGLSTVVPASMNINGSSAVTWNPSYDIAMLGSTDDNDKIKGGTVTLSGTPIKKWTINAGIDGLKKENLDDIFMLIKYII